MEVDAMFYKVSRVVGGVLFRVLSLHQGDQVLMGFMRALTTAYESKGKAQPAS